MILLFKTKSEAFTFGLLKKLISSAIVFQEIDPKFLSVLQEISSCNFECDKKKYCIMKEDGECQLIIPKYNLNLFG